MDFEGEPVLGDMKWLRDTGVLGAIFSRKGFSELS
jgi:hypothetical protein